MKLWLKYLGFAAVATSMTLASCGDDTDDPLPPINTNDAPTLELRSLVDGSTIDSFSFDMQDQVGSLYGISIVADDIDANLQTISFDIDGMPASSATNDIKPDSITSILGANPLLVDSAGFTRTFYFRSSADFATSVTYTITVTDTDGETASADFVLTTPVEVVSTPLTFNATGVLLNAGGPSGQGGLDLDTGSGDIGSSDMSAEIRDQGIDLNLPPADNWLRRIAPVNGALLRVPSASFFMDLSFDDIDSKELVQAAFESSSVDTPQSDVVQAGDVFAVSANGRFYLMQVESITVTPDNNNDGYSFSIKY